MRLAKELEEYYRWLLKDNDPQILEQNMIIIKTWIIDYIKDVFCSCDGIAHRVNDIFKCEDCNKRVYDIHKRLSNIA